MDNGTILMLTYGIIGVIAVMTIYALISDRAGVAQSAPSILTSLGIFGTFLGITLGLAGFDAGDVENSITYLFAGIKLAFWTSVAGILGGILVKFRHLMLYTEDGPRAGAATIEDLLKAMRGVESSLTDGKNASLLSELRDLQAAANARGDESQKLLSDMQAATQANAGNLEQLGESLLAGVGKDLSAINEQLEQSSSRSAQSLGDVAQAIERLKTAMGGDSAAVLKQLETLREGSDALGKSLGDSMRSSLGANGEALTKALDGNRDALAAQIAAAVTDLRDALVGPDGAASAVGSQLRQGQIDLAKALAQVSESLRASVGEDVDALNQRLAQSSAATAEHMQNVAKAIEQLQSAMGGDTASMLDRMDSLRQGSEVLGDRLSKVLGASNEALATALQNNRDVLAAQIATAVTELRDALVGPDGAATKLGAGLQQGQVELATALARVTESLRTAVGEDVNALNAKLAQSSEATAAQMQNVAKAIEQLQAAMGGDTSALLDRLDVMRQGSETLADRISKVLGGGNEALAKALEGNRDALAAQIATAVTELRDALVGPDGAATDIAERLQQGQIELAAAMARTSDALQSSLGEDAAAMLDRLDGLSGGLSDLADSVAGAFGEAAGGLSGDVSQMATTVADAIDDLRMAIVGPDGARHAIAEEIRNAHADTAKQLGSIHQALKENTQRQVDYSPKGLMTVLEELIRQFNTQFAGQFWEKIGGFNQAIAELLGWMETYRKQLNDMVDQQTKSARNMDVAARRFDDIASKSQIFIDVSTNISSLLGGLDSQRVQMESHLKRFAHIVDETSSNLQNIEEKIIAGNTNMNEHIGEISERIEAQVIRVDRAMDDELKKALITFGQQLAALSEKFVEDYTPLTDRLRDVVNISRGL